MVGDYPMVDYPISISVKVVYTVGASEEEYVIISHSAADALQVKILDAIKTIITDRISSIREVGQLKQLINLIS